MIQVGIPAAGLLAIIVWFFKRWIDGVDSFKKDAYTRFENVEKEFKQVEKEKLDKTECRDYRGGKKC